ncbi:cytochrome b5-like [Wolffia australiana]
MGSTDDASGAVFTLADVSKHNSREDCWLIINDKVYDVTKFLDDHPGGDEVMINATGKDATDDFEDVGHSSTARAMLNEYLVGAIDTSTIASRPKTTQLKQAQDSQDKGSDLLIRLLQFLVPLAILGLAVAVRFYTKSA